MADINDTAKHPKNLILYGPPGTGKTYEAVRLAIEIVDGQRAPESEVTDRFQSLRKSHRIGFVTFHPSYSYEDFIEGIRPVLSDETEDAETESTSEGNARYQIRPGIFKKMCETARSRPLQEQARESIDLESVSIWKMSLGNSQQSSESYSPLVGQIGGEFKVDCRWLIMPPFSRCRPPSASGFGSAPSGLSRGYST